MSSQSTDKKYINKWIAAHDTSTLLTSNLREISDDEILPTTGSINVASPLGATVEEWSSSFKCCCYSDRIP